jgi:hypothetical protein
MVPGVLLLLPAGAARKGVTGDYLGGFRRALPLKTARRKLFEIAWFV